jgi:hypothetical protein
MKLRRSLVITTLITLSLCLARAAVAHPSWGIVVDGNNQVYFSDLETVWKIDAKGKLSVFRAGVSGRHIHELAIDEDGNLYGADYSYEPATKSYINAIWKMTPAGSFNYILEPTKELPRGMSILRDRVGNTYYVEQNNHLKRETLLVKRTPDGRVSVLAGGAYGHADGQGAQAKFSSIVGMAFGPDGSLYLADDKSVRKVTMDGVVTTVANGIDPKGAVEVPAWGGLMGLAVGAQGDVYVADYRNRLVLKVAPTTGAVTTVAQSEEGWSPTGVAASRNGDLYILEFRRTPPSTDTPRVRKLSPDGKISLLTGEDMKPASDESGAGRSSIRGFAGGLKVAYVILALAAVVSLLSLFIWRLRRRVSAEPHS